MSAVPTRAALLAIPVNDAYSTDFEEELEVDEPGVLANDINIGDDRADLTRDAAHGDVNLNNDGGFKYKPDDGFSGTDTFRYKLEGLDQHASHGDDHGAAETDPDANAAADTGSDPHADTQAHPDPDARAHPDPDATTDAATHPGPHTPTAADPAADRADAEAHRHADTSARGDRATGHAKPDVSALRRAGRQRGAADLGRAECRGDRCDRAARGIRSAGWGHRHCGHRPERTARRSPGRRRSSSATSISVGWAWRSNGSSRPSS